MSMTEKYYKYRDTVRHPEDVNRYHHAPSDELKASRRFESYTLSDKIRDVLRPIASREVMVKSLDTLSRVTDQLDYIEPTLKMRIEACQKAYGHLSDYVENASDLSAYVQGDQGFDAVTTYAQQIKGFYKAAQKIIPALQGEFWNDINRFHKENPNELVSAASTKFELERTITEMNKTGIILLIDKEKPGKEKMK